MSFLSEGKRTIKTDEKYESVYQVLSDKTGMSIAEIFFFCVLIGKRSETKSMDFKPGMKEFRPSYFTETQRGVMYGIADTIIPITEIDTPEKVNEIIREYQLLSNGGMEIIISEVLKDRYKDGQLDEKYDGYSIDLMKYLYSKLNAVPF